MLGSEKEEAMNYDLIPSELKNVSRWVCVWNNSKIPMQATQKKAASSVNASTWSTFDEARQAVENGIYDNIGFVFNGDGIIGIDIDAGYDTDGFLSDLSIDCMRACESYTERSRSGRGIHILVKGNLPFKGRNNGSGVEIYREGRYFIVTGEKLIYGQLCECQQGINYIVEKYFPEIARENEGVRRERIYSPQYNRPVAGKIDLAPKYPEILPGMRNMSLTSLAGALHSQGYSSKEIYAELLKCNKTACKPPLSTGEVESIVNSVTRYKR